MTSDLGWERIPVPDSGDGLGAKPAVPEDRYLHANTRMLRDLLDAVETRRQPVCSAYDGRWTIEMVMGAHVAGMSHKREAFPLTMRDNPYVTRQRQALVDV
ncbi:MAG: hypothetical protein FJ029_10830 [Actinobacteria bacterium]|nr:hypothetical protein [Actinomycetota bacterium]